MKRIGIEKIAYSLGSNKLTNQDLHQEKPDWPIDEMYKRTGVRSRPIAPMSETALDLGERAALKLIEKDNSSNAEIDAVIFCTQTPDYLLPPNSVLMHGRLGMPNHVMAFDITHACSGFIYGLSIARSLVLSGSAKRVLFVTADTYTHLLAPDDRSTRGIFGDGAAAVIISNLEPRLEILDVNLFTAGQKWESFLIRSGGARNPLETVTEFDKYKDKSKSQVNNEYIKMDGLGVLSFFNSVVPKAVEDLLIKNDLNIDDISHFVFHQASKLALDGIRRSLAVPTDKMIVTMEDTGNLVSSSIPVALAQTIDKDKLEKGGLIVLCGFGVGLSWGASLVRYY